MMDACRVTPAFETPAARPAETGPEGRPAPRQAADLRAALGRFATGVAVVTSAGSSGPVGMTINSFASVSLDPPLVLWSVRRASLRFPAFAAARGFAIHVLGVEQRPIADAFARGSGTFAGGHAPSEEDEPPLIDGCLARFVCRTVATHDGGDHVILVGRVERHLCRDGAPLLYYRGAYADLGA